MRKRAVRGGDARLAVAALRTSTGDQTNGIEGQRAAIEAWARREGVTVVAWHVDHVSGASPAGERPGLSAALADVREHGAGLLVVAKRDRLARDLLVGATIEAAVRGLGARVVSADGVGGDAPEAKLMAGIVDAVAMFERSMIAARTKAGLGAKKARGERVGGVPFGLMVDVDGVRLVPHAEEQATIARARELRASGLSFDAVGQVLAREGRLARSGRPLVSMQVRRMLADLDAHGAA